MNARWAAAGATPLARASHYDIMAMWEASPKAHFTAQARTVGQRLHIGEIMAADDLLSEFKTCQDFARLEVLADQIGDSGDQSAVEFLLDRLGGERVQGDPDVEAAVCDALVKLRVMRTDGVNLRYKFLNERFLRPEVAKLIHDYWVWLPGKYFERPSN